MGFRTSEDQRRNATPQLLYSMSYCPASSGSKACSTTLRQTASTARSRCSAALSLSPIRMSHLRHEVHHGGQGLGIGRHPDAGDRSFQFRGSMFICNRVHLPTSSSSSPEVKDSPCPLPCVPARRGNLDGRCRSACGSSP